jgi:hypothetical protein
MKWLTKIFGEKTSKKTVISAEGNTKISVRNSEKLIDEFRTLEHKLEHWATLKEEKKGLIIKVAGMSNDYLQACEKYYGCDTVPYTTVAEYCEAAYVLLHNEEQEVGKDTINIFVALQAEGFRKESIEYYIQAADQNLNQAYNKKTDGAEYIAALRRLGEDGKADALVETMQRGGSYLAREIREQVIESKDLR